MLIKDVTSEKGTLSKAIEAFTNKGITPVMFSCNATNLLGPTERRIERQDILGKELFMDTFTYTDAGKGYAWIMIDFEKLSEDNKKFMFDLEEKKNDRGEEVGKKAIWFVHPFIFKYMNINDSVARRFYKDSLVLSYDGEKYPEKTVILRMPIKQDTTIEEVDDYFSKIAEGMKNQRQRNTNFIDVI